MDGDLAIVQVLEMPAALRHGIDHAEDLHPGGSSVVHQGFEVSIPVPTNAG
jgi:hypothetical protein